MNARKVLAVVMALLVVAPNTLFLQGCSNEQNTNPITSAAPPTDNTVNPNPATDSLNQRGNQQPTAASYPNYSFGLGVPYVYQILPGGTREGTKTCGQACAAMLGGYFNHVAISQQTIINEDNWLNSLFPGLGYNTPNSYYTNFDGRNALGRLLREYHGLQYAIYYGNHADDVINEILRGRPVIVGVMISGGRLVSSGGVAHWAIAKGWDSRIILNDPGTSAGNSIAYSVDTFEASWATQGKKYIPVWK
jgi:hypothetical protein